MEGGSLASSMPMAWPGSATIQSSNCSGLWIGPTEILMVLETGD